MPINILKKIWPEWSIGKRIGGGAYGTVYEASRNEYGVDNHAAIKIISIPASESEIDTLRSEGLDMQATKTHFQTIVNDFVNEIRLMVSLEGRPNIVNVKDYKVVEKKGEFGWHIFILMELLTPFAVYTCDHQMTEAEVIKLGCDICTALETCAEEKIIHRDIKPGNILVHKSGDFKLGDFGIARKLENMTGGLSQRYTPKYMAPEVATSMYYDERVDIYSLGIVLYELLNGRRIPFQPNKQINSLADIETAVRRRNSGEAFDGPSNASPAMADLILRACAYDPNMRFASATEMKQALMSVANGTYEMSEIGKKDRIITDRRAPAEYDKTTTVRKAPAASNQKSGQAVNTFGNKPKKNNLPKIIAVVAVVAILITVGVFATKYLTMQKEIASIIDESDVLATAEDFEGAIAKIEEGLDEYSDSEDLKDKLDEYSNAFEAQQIALIISDAEGLAASEDYEGALTKVQGGLVTYPASQNLQNKVNEYTEALNVQIKNETLAEAEALAESGDYVSAMAVINKAQETYGDNTEYQKAHSAYNDAYNASVKTEAITTADGLAANGDYIGAFQTIETALNTIGEDKELQQKAQSYEDLYIADIVEQIDSYLKAKDYDSATNTVNNALKMFPNNKILAEEQKKIEESKPKYLLDVITPYEKPYHYEDHNGMPFYMGGQSYKHGFTCMGYGDRGYGNLTYFNLGGKYDELSFIAGIVDGEAPVNGESIVFSIAVDGTVVDSFEISEGDLPVSRTVDISGCKQLVISVYSHQGTAFYDGHYGIAEIKIS